MPRWSSRVLEISAAVALGSYVIGGEAAAQTSVLYRFDYAPVSAPFGSAAVVEARRVEVNPSLLAGGPLSLELELFDGSRVRALATRVERRGRDRLTWRGRVVPDGGRVTLTLKADIVVGVVNFEGQLFELTTLPDGGQVLVAYDTSLRLDCAGTLDPPTVYDSLAEPEPPVAGDPPGRIDVMAVYTPQARSAAGGVLQIEAAIQNAVDLANTAFGDSGIDTRFNLVHAQEVSYNDSGDLYTDLPWVTNDPTVASLRNTHSADLVSLTVENGGGFCGLGYVMRNPSASFANWAYQVTDRGCFSNFSWSHEHGHNMGLEHDPANGASPSSASYPWSFGHFVSGEFRTVMSYSNQCTGGCPRVGRFSNPDSNYAGAPTGIENERDNRLTTNLTADIVSDFRTQICTVDVNLWVQSQTFASPQLLQACETITVGPSVVIQPSGDVTFEAGTQLVLQNGFSVQSSGGMTVVLDPLTGAYP